MAKAVSWGSRRPTAAAALIYLILSLAMFSPALLPGKNPVRPPTTSESSTIPWEYESAGPKVPVLGSNRELTDLRVLM